MKNDEAITVLKRLLGTVKLPEEAEALSYALAMMGRMKSAPPPVIGEVVAVVTPCFPPEKVAQAPLRYRENY